MYDNIFAAAWDMMNNELTIIGFTFTYAQVFIFHLICIFLARFISIIFMLRDN